MFAQRVHHDSGRLHEGVATLLAMCAELPADLLEWQPGGSEWSIKQIVFHLGDAFEAMVIRIGTMLRETTPDLLRFDAAQWAIDRRYQQRPWQEAVEHMQRQLHRLTDLVRDLDEAQLARTGRQHNIAVNYLRLPTAVLAIHDLIHFEAGHVDEHIVQIDERIAQHLAYADA